MYIIEKYPDVLERSLDMYIAKYKNLTIICNPNADFKSELYETFHWNLWLNQS